MSSRSGKKYKDARQKVDRDKFYSLEEALAMIKDLSFTKFDESVDVAVRLGVNPRHADQMVRGSVLLPHGTGKETRVLVFAKGEKEKEATDAGADFVGAEDLIDKISKGWLEFDKAIATPDMMGMVGKIGKVLGPRGMMPNPKVGTVTFNISDAVSDLKKGKIEFKVDKAGIIHATTGKKSFTEEKLKDNITALLDALVKLKPSTSKGVYLRGIVLSTTMGPGIKVDPAFTRKIG
ncbi:MAG: 50S ribosomal protein L1 [Thermodesulfobacteriota bacterium]|nr:50S ribosomal protein L1 [Thermodesulfobacteriota bacterium]